MRQLIEEEAGGFTEVINPSGFSGQLLKMFYSFKKDPFLRDKFEQEDERKRAQKCGGSFVNRDLEARQRSEVYRSVLSFFIWVVFYFTFYIICLYNFYFYLHTSTNAYYTNNYFFIRYAIYF